jgi:transcriptional regulator with XRE-family HTH domain
MSLSAGDSGRPRDRSGEASNLQELGTFLRRMREERGYSIDDVVEGTKVRATYLRAIEDGDLRPLPGLVYARGFIRSYAEFLGLKGTEIANAYLGAQRREDASSSQPPAAPPRARRSPRRAPVNAYARRLTIVTAGVVLITAGVVTYALTSGGGASGVRAPTDATVVARTGSGSRASATGATVHGSSTASASKSAASDGALTPLAFLPNHAVYDVAGAAGISLVVKGVSGYSWIGVVADGVTIWTGDIDQGTQKVFTAEHTLSLRVGRGPLLALVVNGRPVKMAKVYTYTYDFVQKAATSAT